MADHFSIGGLVAFWDDKQGSSRRGRDALLRYTAWGGTMDDATINRENFTLDSVLGSVERVEETAERFAGEAGFDGDTASHIAMVAREAAVNGIVHGNKYDAGKHLWASFELTEEELRIEIADEGAGLDVEGYADPTLPENLLRTSGRGIFLMRALMDEVHFRQLNPGTQITLIKRRSQKETEA